MKNSIFFKFIAVLLCAASLTGIVGAAAGILILTEYDLYNKTVPQVRQQRQEEAMEHMADLVAKDYTNQVLGGCSPSMTDRKYGTVEGSLMGMWDLSGIGYEIVDGEGNVLESSNTELLETADTLHYEFPVTGQYMHLVDLESEAEMEARTQERAAALYAADAAAMEGVFTDLDGETIPAEGASVVHASFTDVDGRVIYEAYENGYGVTSHYYRTDGTPRDTTEDEGGKVGFLFYNRAGRLVFRAQYWDGVNFPETGIEVGGIYFNCDDGMVFQYGPSGDEPVEPIGLLSMTEDRDVTFVTYYPADAAEEKAEEPVPAETVAEVTEATAAAEVTEPVMAAEETAPMETIGETVEVTEVTEVTEATEAPAETQMVEETVPSSASAIPEETGMTEPVAATAATEAAVEPTAARMIPQETAAQETVPEETEPVLINGKTLDHYQVNSMEYYDSDVSMHMSAKYVYLPMPEMTVKVFVAEDAYRFESTYELLGMLRPFRQYLLPAIGVCLLVFAIFGVYLCTAAGRKPKREEVRAGGLNALPLDFYTVNAGAGICGVVALIGVLFNEGINNDFMVGMAAVGGLVFAGCLLVVGYCFAFVAQCKTPGGYWWRNTVTVRCIMLFVRFGQWLERFLAEKGFPFLGRIIKGTWRLVIRSFIWLYRVTEKVMLWVGDKLAKFFRWIGDKLSRFLSLLPLTWQWLLVGVIIMLFSLLIHSYYDFYIFLGFVVPIAIVLYVAHCFGSLFEATRKMSKGDLDAKIDDKLMVGCFKDFAADLTDLGDVAVVAAQKQLKSERMKTELITNVSHDIKTPLTSIINYVDLLQKPHTEEEGEQYLEVLDRQSQRLKKLIDDLMDMSKASTGNMAVEITKVDAVESVNQALGEFSDKLERAQLIPVFRHTEPSVAMMADGKLVWRVLSNLLGNAVKYAMPGTRLYLDLAEMEGKVILSLKNISRDELNVDADELMERFVRGDDSRNTEGSGLGLNIAKSLMELQKGQLQLLVDGDLFKITLIFPGA